MTLRWIIYLFRSKGKNPDWEGIAKMIKQENGFDSIAHEEMRKEIRSGKISIEGNRLPASTIVEDVQQSDVLQVPGEWEDRSRFRSLVEQGESVPEGRRDCGGDACGRAW